MSDTKNKEAVGKHFDKNKMLVAAEKTMLAVDTVAARICAGMTELQASEVCKEVLAEMGADRTWHRSIVRFGSDTLRTFKARGNPDKVLEENDIFFLDFGVVWDRHEGDAGATFVVGDDPEHVACAQAARQLWQQVAEYWRQTGCTGQELYDWADSAAKRMGYVLNQDIKGHRVSDFPHAIYRAGDLGEFDQCPQVGLWILEIQIRHSNKDFGAFYEDLLCK